MNSSGADVVLTRFPSSGSTLIAFSLAPAAVKSIAIPNDIQEWPTSALNGCTNLEKITVYGEEAQTGELSITREHGLYNFSKLTSIQLPSTVISVGDYVNSILGNAVFPNGLSSIKFSSNLVEIGNAAFTRCSLKFVDFSNCKKLRQIASNWAFRENWALQSLDLSPCSCLTRLGSDSFLKCHQMSTVVFPPSLQNIRYSAFYATVGERDTFVKTVIWVGRSTRLPTQDSNYGIVPNAFGSTPLEDLVESGAITEIFLP